MSKISSKHWFQYTVALVFIFGYFFFVNKLYSVPIPTENKDTLILLISALNSGVGLIVGYLFGSSKSSADKNELLLNKTPEQNG